MAITIRTAIIAPATIAPKNSPTAPPISVLSWDSYRAMVNRPSLSHLIGLAVRPLVAKHSYSRPVPPVGRPDNNCYPVRSMLDSVLPPENRTYQSLFAQASPCSFG